MKTENIKYGKQKCIGKRLGKDFVLEEYVAGEYHFRLVLEYQIPIGVFREEIHYVSVRLPGKKKWIRTIGNYNRDFEARRQILKLSLFFLSGEKQLDWPFVEFNFDKRRSVRKR